MKPKRTDLLLLSCCLMILVGCSEKRSQEHSEKTKNINVHYTDVVKYKSRIAPYNECQFYFFHNLDTAIRYAKRESKNLLLIFEGLNCNSNGANRIWRTLELYHDDVFIHEKFIIVRLLVDYGKRLPYGPQTEIVDKDTFKIETVGELNQFLEIKIAGANYIPAFCIVDTNLKLHGDLLGLPADKEKVNTFINRGIQE